ncbi:MAG: transporter substrate-binding domain-containing protein [Fusobacteriaceae bacterium]
MNNLFKKIFFVAIALILFGCEKKEDKLHRDKVFIVGTNAEYPPFEYLENEKIKGLDPDIIEEVFKKLGYQYKWVNMEFGGLISALQTGKIDLIIAGMSITEERMKTVDFTAPYLVSNTAFLTNKNNPIMGMDDLANKKFGVALGTTQEQKAKNIKEATVISYPSNTSALLALKTLQVDGVLFDESVATGYINNNSELKIVGISEGVEKAIALRKNDESYDEINNALMEVIKEGTIKKLKEKYDLN